MLAVCLVCIIASQHMRVHQLRLPQTTNSTVCFNSCSATMLIPSNPRPVEHGDLPLLYLYGTKLVNHPGAASVTFSEVQKGTGTWDECNRRGLCGTPMALR